MNDDRRRLDDILTAPHTVAGRLIGILTMVVGISTFAIVTAKVAEFLVRSDRADEPPPLDAGPEHFDLRGGEADTAP